MIKLNDRFYLDADERNIMILESKIYADGKKAGTEYKDIIAYCSTPQNAIEYIQRKLAREKIADKTILQTFDEYQKSLEKINKEVEKMLAKTK